MNKKLIHGLAGIMAALFAVGANAATVSVNPGAITANAGTQFSATIQADFTGSAGITDGGFSLVWDPTLLSLVAGTGTSAYLTNAFDAFSTKYSTVDAFGNPITVTSDGATLDTSKVASGILDFSFSNCALISGFVCDSVGTVFDVFNLVFQVAAGAPVGAVTTAALDIGILGNTWYDTAGVFYNNTGGSPVNFTSATIEITAVPVPAAVWLLGSGLIGLVGVARRRSTTTAIAA